MSTLFGTDGIRGTIGTSPFTLQDTIRLGTAIGIWITTTYGPNAHIIIAHDTRQSGDWLTNALCAGLLLSPITVHLAGVLPTPAVSHLLKDQTHLDCGIILSASHNPFSDNGIKIINREQGKISEEEEQAICHLYEQAITPSYKEFGSTVLFQHAADLYISSLTNQFRTLSLAGQTIVLDCAHGATHAVAPLLFCKLGAQVITMHSHPTGTNINEQCGALYPHSLQRAVIEYNANFGCAFDGDGDRVILVNNAGRVKNGDDILALLSEHHSYKHQPIVIGTVMSNQGLEQYLLSKQKQLLRTAVGDRWIAAQLTHQNLLLGGEQSGHVILRDILPTGDGIATALRVIESVMQNKNWSMETFDTYPQKLINIPVRYKKDLKEAPIADIITEYQKQLTSGRVYVRYSGTENVLRVMVEDQEDDAAHRICSHLAKALEQELQ